MPNQTNATTFMRTLFLGSRELSARFSERDLVTNGTKLSRAFVGSGHSTLCSRLLGSDSGLCGRIEQL